jgi:uncharacterized heparinase superfamily protein
MTVSELTQLGRTLVHLRPGQVAHRARLRGQRAAVSRWPAAGRRLLSGPDPATAVGWPVGYVPLDGREVSRWPRPADLQSGHMRLLGMGRDLGEPRDWQQADAPQLWRFHLHYWDWAWGLAADRDRTAARSLFAELWQAWRSTVVIGRGDAWHPYPAALRAWSFCGLHRDLVAGSELEESFISDLAVHAGFLRRHLELDVGGNHLVKNLKALAGLAVFFADDRLLHWALRRLTAQLANQVLPDGGHYERAPAYHCQVLADLIDVADLLRAAGRTPAPELDLAIGRMRTWLGVVLSPTGAVPLLNDGYPVDPALLALLDPAPQPTRHLQLLPETGLVRATAGDWHLLADVGPPCPADLPAHAHADSLTCTVHVAGVPVLVDTGTSTYAPGPGRNYERSTAAHNTVEVDGTDSTEVWGAFRAARRARVRDIGVSGGPGEIVVTAAHDGFRALPGRPLHRRRWSLTPAGLQVQDEVTGRGRHVITVRWHLAPGSDVRLTETGAEIMTSAGPLGVGIAATVPLAVTAEISAVATGFDRTVPAAVLTCRTEASLPCQISTSWCRADPGQPDATRTSQSRSAGAPAAAADLVCTEGAR